MHHYLRPTGLALALALAGTAGCDSDTASPAVTLNFAAMVGTNAFSCGSTFDISGTDGTANAAFTDFRLYIHDIELTRADGTTVAAPIASRSPWQRPEVALLDFEDASGTCTNGTAETNTYVTTTAPVDDYTGVSFTVGVPFALNHGDAASAASPLDLSGLFWNWNAGYKFIRIDARFDGNHFVPFHVGSVGCAMDQTTGTVRACERPNRPRVTLNAFNPATDTIIIDAAALHAGLEVKNEANAGCQSSPDTAECGPMFDAIGLDIDSADLTDGQTLFTVKGQ